MGSYTDNTGAVWQDGGDVWTLKTTDNGTSFVDTLGGLFESGAKLAGGIAQVVNATKNKPTQTTVAPVAYVTPPPAPAASGGFNNQMLILGAAVAVVLVLAFK